MAQIIADSLTYFYGEAEDPALHNVSFTIRTGEFVAIIGANNSGKSSLCYALSGVVPHLSSGRIEGSVLIAGKDTKDKTVSEIAQWVGLVLQVPGSQMSGVRFNVFEEVAFGLENRGVPRDQIIDKVETVLTLIGLEEFAARSPFELSGGQQQRLALATALAVNPDIIILDEPTTLLDPQGAKLVFDILHTLHQQGKTIVVAEQRLDLIAHYAKRVIALEKGSLVMDGSPREVLTSPSMHSIQLEWTRYTQVAHLAQSKNSLSVYHPLPASLQETIDAFSKRQG